MIKRVINSPLFTFFIIAVVITQASMLFLQNIGPLQKVSGWPLVMYKVEYKRVGEVGVGGEVIHKIVQDKSYFLWERFFVNVILWTILFQTSWMLYKSFFEKDTRKAVSKKQTA